MTNTDTDAMGSEGLREAVALITDCMRMSMIDQAFGGDPEVEPFSVKVASAIGAILAALPLGRGRDMADVASDGPRRVEADTQTPPEVVDYIRRWGGMCRDCADEDGVCPGKGLPCEGAAADKAIRHVLAALSYGMSNRFIEWRPDGPLEGQDETVVAATRSGGIASESLSEANALQGEVGRLREALKVIVDGTYPSEPSKTFAGRCIHGAYEHEECLACAEDFARQALNTEGGKA